MGAGAETKVYARNVTVQLSGVEISPVCTSDFRQIFRSFIETGQGDLVFCDPLEGVVIIPSNAIDDVLGLMPKLVEADDQVKEAVQSGMSVAEAFKKYRG